MSSPKEAPVSRVTKVENNEIGYYWLVEVSKDGGKTWEPIGKVYKY